MVIKISRKEYTEIIKRRKMRPNKELGFLVFKGADYKYYKTTKSGMQGAKEMHQYNKRLKKNIENQLNLL